MIGEYAAHIRRVTLTALARTSAIISAGWRLNGFAPPFLSRTSSLLRGGFVLCIRVCIYIHIQYIYIYMIAFGQLWKKINNIPCFHLIKDINTYPDSLRWSPTTRWTIIYLYSRTFHHSNQDTHHLVCLRLKAPERCPSVRLSEAWNALFSPVHGSVGLSDQPWPFCGMSVRPFVRPSVRRGFRAFAGERIEGMVWNFACWYILATLRTG